MAFEMLSERLQKVVKRLRGQARLTESNVEEILKEIRIALIDADVNTNVVKSFIADVKEKMLGTEVIGKLNPSQMVVKIVNDEIKELLGKIRRCTGLHPSRTSGNARSTMTDIA